MPNNDDTEGARNPKKVFDVAPPGETPAPATARPVIVGHGPMAGDPMMADPDTKIDTEGAPKEGVPISVLTKKLKIQPIHPELVPDQPNERPPEAPAPPQETPAAEAAVTTPEASVVAQPAASEPPESPAAPQTPDAASEPVTVSALTQKEQDEAAKKAAAESAEKLAGYEKVIDSKQYFVPINAVRHKRSMRMLVVGALVVIVAALVCINFMLDAGTLMLPFNVPHTHLIKQ